MLRMIPPEEMRRLSELPEADLVHRFERMLSPHPYSRELREGVKKSAAHLEGNVRKALEIALSHWSAEPPESKAA